VGRGDRTNVRRPAAEEAASAAGPTLLQVFVGGNSVSAAAKKR
jgi:hypothetical protein